MSFEGSRRNFPNISLAEAGYDHSTIYLVTYLLAAHIPFILSSNILVMIVIRLVKKLHTPHNAILFALAGVDFMCGMKLIIQIIDNDSFILKETHAGCLFKQAVPVFWDNSSLNLLMLMCMERSLAINVPFWYIGHIRIRTVVYAVVVVEVLEFLFTIVAYGVLYDYDPEVLDIHIRCDFWNLPLWYVEYAAFIKLWTQIVVSVILSGQVAYVALKMSKKRQQKLKDLDFVSNDTRASERQTNDIRTMVALMFLFILLWLPTLLIPVVYEIVGLGDSQLYYQCSQHFLSLNSYINAILYAFQKPNFKKAYWFLLTTKPTRWKDLNMYIEMTKIENQNKTNFTTEKSKQKTFTFNFTSQGMLPSTIITEDDIEENFKKKGINTSDKTKHSTNSSDPTSKYGTANRTVSRFSFRPPRRKNSTQTETTGKQLRPDQ